MELTWIVFQQTVTMALYMAMGYLLYAGKKISAEGSKSLAAILLWLVIPAVIINSFCVERTGERVQQLLVSAALGTIALAAAIAMAKVLFPKSPVDNFAAAFSNAGFMGIPLVRACFGDDAVFYLVGFVSFLNLLQWTYGASVLSRGKAHGLETDFAEPYFGWAVCRFGSLLRWTGDQASPGGSVHSKGYFQSEWPLGYGGAGRLPGAV